MQLKRLQVYADVYRYSSDLLCVLWAPICAMLSLICHASIMQIFERPDLANSALTSAELAVKRFARTVRSVVRHIAVEPPMRVAGCASTALKRVPETYVKGWLVQSSSDC